MSDTPGLNGAIGSGGHPPEDMSVPGTVTGGAAPEENGQSKDPLTQTAASGDGNGQRVKWAVKGGEEKAAAHAAGDGMLELLPDAVADDEAPKCTLPYITLVELDVTDLARRVNERQSLRKIVKGLTHQYKLANPLALMPGTNLSGFVGTMFHAVDDIDGLLDALSTRRGGADAQSQCSANGLPYFEDDVDILTFLIIHSYTPIQMALSISHKLEERNEDRVDNVGSVSRRKVDLFSRMAVDLTQLIPLGRDFARERFNALSHRGGDPTQVAIFYRNVEFIAQDACQAFFEDTWGEAWMSVEGLTEVLLHPYKRAVPSKQIRWGMFVASNILLSILLVIVADKAKEPGSHNAFFAEFCLYVFVVGKLIGEGYEWLVEVRASVLENPSRTNAEAVVVGLQRYFKLDGWNYLDALLVAGFLFTFAFRAQPLFTNNHDSTLDTVYTMALVALVVPTFFRLLSMFEMHRVLGVLVRSIVNMGQDLVTFAVMFVVVWASFAVAMHLLFHDTPAGSYNTYVDSALTLFNAAVGDFAFSNHEYIAPDSFKQRKEDFGTILLIVYVAACHIMLLNLLIAVMSSTYEFFKENSRNQFLFGRARAIQSSLAKVNNRVLPPPCNLIQVFAWLLFLPVRLFSPKRAESLYQFASDTAVVIFVWPVALAVLTVYYVLRGILVLFTLFAQAIFYLPANYFLERDLDAHIERRRTNTAGPSALVDLKPGSFIFQNIKNLSFPNFSESATSLLERLLEVHYYQTPLKEGCRIYILDDSAEKVTELEERKSKEQNVLMDDEDESEEGDGEGTEGDPGDGSAKAWGLFSVAASQAGDSLVPPTTPGPNAPQWGLATPGMGAATTGSMRYPTTHAPVKARLIDGTGHSVRARILPQNDQGPRKAAGSHGAPSAAAGTGPGAGAGASSAGACTSGAGAGAGAGAGVIDGGRPPVPQQANQGKSIHPEPLDVGEETTAGADPQGEHADSASGRRSARKSLPPIDVTSDTPLPGASFNWSPGHLWRGSGTVRGGDQVSGFSVRLEEGGGDGLAPSNLPGIPNPQSQHDFGLDARSGTTATFRQGSIAPIIDPTRILRNRMAHETSLAAGIGFHRNTLAGYLSQVATGEHVAVTEPLIRLVTLYGRDLCEAVAANNKGGSSQSREAFLKSLRRAKFGDLGIGIRAVEIPVMKLSHWHSQVKAINSLLENLRIDAEPGSTPNAELFEAIVRWQERQRENQDGM